MASPTSSPNSLGALLRGSCAKYASRVALLVPRDGNHAPITYAELYELVRRWASGLRSLGIARGDRLCILAENSLEWALLDWACQTQGVVVVPIYPTLPADQVAYIVQDCGAKVVVCGDAGQLAKVQPLTGPRSILLKNSPDAESYEQVASQAALLSPEAFDSAISATEAEATATIIYTSGTTGLPKGAMLPHRSFLWMIQAVSGNFGIDQDDVFFSFLPLCHVYERANGHFLPIGLGATIAYTKNMASLAGDIAKVGPTLLLCVPRFLESIRDRILDGVKKQKPIPRQLFLMTLTQSQRRRKGKLAPLYPLLNRVVGTKIRRRMGGNLRFFISGGAPLPRHVYDFYTAFGIKILQGYGLTETTGAVAVNNPLLPIRPDTVGEVFNGIECRIAEDGEIIIRGPAVMTGYYNLPEETAAAIDPSGWFHTGDIGEFVGEHLKITDRKKDLLVLGNGKNVAPQPLEHRLKAIEYIAEAVVLGDGMDHCVALVVPHFPRLRDKLAISSSEEELLANPEVRALIKREIDAMNKTLAGFEMVKKHALLAAPFTIEGGELTPTLKVKRRVVCEKYADIIATLQ